MLAVVAVIVFLVAALPPERMVAQRVCTPPDQNPTTPYGYMPLYVASLIHGKAAVDIEPARDDTASNPADLLYRFRVAANEYDCAAGLLRRSVPTARDSTFLESAVWAAEAFVGLARITRAKATILKRGLDAIDQHTPRMGYGTMADSMASLSQQQHLRGQMLLLATAHAATGILDFNLATNRLEFLKLTSAERDSLAGTMRETFGEMLDRRKWPSDGADWPTAAASTLYRYLVDPAWRTRR